MPERLKYHFEPQSGWMNDPNGLIFFKGQYHAFFQHSPGTPYPFPGGMHWGHAVSDDLINWTELPIALYPDMPYENSGGCYSGSAVEKDGRLYLFYTSVSKTLGQTQSVAFSDDGIHFEKYVGNPVIDHFPDDGSADFRDPKVSLINGTYYMVCGSVKDGVGKAMLFKSDDLFVWDYVGPLYESDSYHDAVECPDFFPYGDKFILMFSKMGCRTRTTQFVYGDFDGRRLTPLSLATPEVGPHFYAPQTFLDAKGRRIIIGWLYSWNKKLDKGADYAGALSIPRELKVENGVISTFPVAEATHLLTDSDPLVKVSENRVDLDVRFPVKIAFKGKAREIAVLRDTKTIEVFINGGECSFTYWFGK